MLAGRRIVLGVSGGVAAYKAAFLARRLIERDADLRVVMTSSAASFVGPATFAALTGEHPVVDLFDDADVSPHTTLGRWADAMVVAPATASTLAKLATGESSNALTATLLATEAPVILAPAMHTEMWEHPATQDNIERLRDMGYGMVGPESGDLAGGDVGVGRMAEPEEIVDAVSRLFEPGALDGVSVLITAGGTREPIDPVRYIGNRSSGKMGNALAEAVVRHGGRVTLVTTAPAPTHPAISVIEVETADQMAAATWSATGHDVAICAAAVADFRPRDATDVKLRRSDGPPMIGLEPTPDVLAGLVERAEIPLIVGFAAETGSLDEAVAKARRKDVDLLVANDVAKDGSGFGSDTNEVTLIHRDGSAEPLPLMSKDDVADHIVRAIAELRT